MWLGLIPLLLFQRTPAVESRVPDKEKQARNLIGQIQRLSASEPGAYGIDTRLFLADAIQVKYPALARELLRDSLGALSGVKNPGRQNGLRVRIVERLAPFDLSEAEEVARTVTRVNGEDYPAAAYDTLCAFLEGHRAEQRGMITRGLAAGAFRMQNGVGELKREIDSAPGPAQALFSEMLTAFPAPGQPAEQDVFLLIDLAGDIRPVSQPLTLQAIDRALDAAGSDKLQLNPDPDDKQSNPRPEMLARISKLIESMDAEIGQRYRDQLQKLHDEMPRDPPKSSETSLSEFVKPDDSPYSGALENARKQDDLSHRVEALINLSRREDLTPQQRASVASEAVTTALKLPIGGDRLLSLAMLSRDFARRNELASAAQAAQYLSDSYGKVCDCPDAYCEHNRESFDCLDLVESFAEYLDEFKISPESMALDNISLQSRLLILKLKELLK